MPGALQSAKTKPAVRLTNVFVNKLHSTSSKLALGLMVSVIAGVTKIATMIQHTVLHPCALVMEVATLVVATPVVATPVPPRLQLF